MRTADILAAANVTPVWADSGSLEACDESDSHACDGSYCPNALLRTFTLLMAGHGRCVRADMMLGDREYAMWQLARARAVGDGELNAVAARLFAWFTAQRAGA